MAGYIGVPFETDPDVLVAEALDSLIANVPGFDPKEAHLEVWVLEVAARMNAETRNVGRLVPDSIFRYFGESLVSVVPVEAVSATALSLWTLQDDAGYTIEEGTLLAYRVTGDQLVAFVTAEVRVVPPGTSTASVPIRASDVGTAANGIGTAGLELVDALAFVTSVAADDVTSGGVDAETDAAYLSRLRDEMRLLTPRFVLAEDAAVLARRIVGVQRALGIDNYDPGTDEIQRVTVTDATGGTFTVTFEGQTTGALGWEASASEIQAELEGLSNVEVGEVAAAGGPLGTAAVDVTFTAGLGVSDRTEMTATSSLTGGGAAVTLATPTEGAAASTGNEKMVTVAVVGADGLPLSQEIKDEVAAYLQTLREVNFIIHVIDPTYTEVAVTFTVVAESGYDLVDLDTRTEAAVNAYLSAAIWAGGGESPPTWRATDSVVRYLEIAEILNRVEGVDYVSALAVNGDTVNVSLTGVAPLPTVGSVTGSATDGS
jgi:uncharacterized phage protein gp47/JayE